MSKQEEFLPDGPWEGFYLEFRQIGKHPMRIEFTFKDGNITGFGTDPVGRHTWAGSYDTTNFHVQMLKSYATHDIQYKGHADENGIWGKWNFASMSFLSEGFHIWPVNKEENKEEMTLSEKIEELKKRLVEM